MLRILFTRYREGVDPKPTLKKFEALAHVSAGLTRVQWGEPSGVSPFDMGAVAEAWSQCIVFTFASAEALEHFTTSVDHEELWTEHNGLLVSIPEGMMVFDIPLGSTIAAPAKHARGRRR